MRGGRGSSSNSLVEGLGRGTRESGRIEMVGYLRKRKMARLG